MGCFQLCKVVCGSYKCVERWLGYCRSQGMNSLIRRKVQLLATAYGSSLWANPVHGYLISCLRCILNVPIAVTHTGCKTHLLPQHLVGWICCLSIMQQWWCEMGTCFSYRRAQCFCCMTWSPMKASLCCNIHCWYPFKGSFCLLFLWMHSVCDNIKRHCGVHV